MDDEQGPETLSQLIENSGMSIKFICEYCDIPRTTLHDWCKGAVPQSPKKAAKLAKLLGVSFQRIYLGEPSEEEIKLKKLRDFLKN